MEVVEVSELRPCPFCGGEAELCYRETGQAFLVGCTKCEASSPFGTEEEVIAAWNKRVPDKKSELLKRYCEVIEEYVSIYDNFPEDLQDIATEARELLEEDNDDE